MIRLMYVLTLVAGILLCGVAIQQARAAEATATVKVAVSAPDAGPAAAAQPLPVATLGSDATAWAKTVYDDVRGGKWLVVAGLLLIGVVFALRKWVVPAEHWFTTDRGGVTLVFLVSAVGAVANALAAGLTPNLQTFVTAGEVGLTAIGGYAGIKRLFKPADKAAPVAEAPPAPAV